MTALPRLEKRRRATQQTKDKFFGKAFSWEEGRHCVKLAHSHLRAMGWRGPKLPKLPKIGSAAEAKAALKERGWTSVSDMLDSFLPRIPPAMMWPGDIGVMPGDEGFESVLILLAPRKMLGFTPDGTQVVIYDAEVSEFTGAWRVETA